MVFAAHTNARSLRQIKTNCHSVQSVLFERRRGKFDKNCCCCCLFWGWPRLPAAPAGVPQGHVRRELPRSLARGEAAAATSEREVGGVPWGNRRGSGSGHLREGPGAAAARRAMAAGGDQCRSATRVETAVCDHGTRWVEVSRAKQAE